MHLLLSSVLLQKAESLDVLMSCKRRAGKFVYLQARLCKDDTVTPNGHLQGAMTL